MKPRIPPGDLNLRNRILVSMLPWKLVKLFDLPRTFKSALIEHIHKDKQPSSFDELAERLGGPRTRIGVVAIPMQMLILQVMNDPSQRRGDFECFEQYHREYMQDNRDRVPAYKEQWPIILSGTSWQRETIVDGWHRFHSYYRACKKKVPALWYADE